MSEKANIHLLTFNVIVPLSINLKPQVFEKNKYSFHAKKKFTNQLSCEKSVRKLHTISFSLMTKRRTRCTILASDNCIATLK